MGFFNYSPLLDTIDKFTNGKGSCQYKEAGNSSTAAFCSNPNLPTLINLNPGHKIDSMSYELYSKHVNMSTPFSQLPTPAPMDGFVEYHARVAKLNDNQLGMLMSSFNESSIPVISDLAKNYLVFNRWFSSLPGETQPNRAFIHSNTASGLDENYTIRRLLEGGFGQKSMWEVFTEWGIGWGNYWQEAPTMMYFRALRNRKFWGNFKFFNRFAKDAKEGNLPMITFTDPIYGQLPWNKGIQNDGHPQCGHSDFANTEKLLQEMYKVLRSSPQWSEMLWIITFDENGGFPDHVAPPAAPRPDSHASDSGFLYDRLGLRVPTILVSPWVKKGRIVLDGEQGSNSDGSGNGEFEHSSIAATLFRLFGIEGEKLTNRTSWASPFDFLFKEVEKERRDCPESVGLKKGAVAKRDNDDARRSLEQAESKTIEAYTDLTKENGDAWNVNPYIRMFQDNILGKMTEEELQRYQANNM